MAEILRDMGRDDGVDAVARGIVLANVPRVRFDVNRARAIVEQVARFERPFERWSFADDSQGEADYLVDLHFDVEQGHYSLDRGYLALATAGLSTLVGGICTESRVTLEATISGPAAVRTRSYGLSDSVATHANGPAGSCETISESTRPDIFGALLRQLFARMAQDRLPQSLADGGATAPSAALVCIEARRAEGIVREATIAAEPFPRYVFARGSAASPARYVLHIDITTAPAAPRRRSWIGDFGVGALFGLTGINLMCPATRFTLQAHLSDRTGATLGAYEISREFIASGSRNKPSVCQDDENSNPQAARELVDELYRRMGHDGAAALLSAH